MRENYATIIIVGIVWAAIFVAAVKIIDKVITYFL